MVYFLSYLVMTFEEIYKTQKQIFLRGDANLFQSSRGMRVCRNASMLQRKKKKKKTLIRPHYSNTSLTAHYFLVISVI